MRNLSVQLLLSQLAKMLCFLIIAYVFPSTKLEIKAEQVLPGSKGCQVEKKGTGVRGEECPYNVCTC
jgi:hypothetical protein